MRNAHAIGLVVVLWVVAACGAASQPSLEFLAVAAQDGPPGGFECPVPAIEGTLATSSRWLLGLAPDQGKPVRGVLWPPGYAAGRVDGRLVLLDQDHRVVAREGDEVRVGGWEGAAGVWIACRTVTVSVRAP